VKTHAKVRGTFKNESGLSRASITHVLMWHIGAKGHCAAGSVAHSDPTNGLALGVRSDIVRELLEWKRSDNNKAAVRCIRMSDRRAHALTFLQTLGRLSLDFLSPPADEPALPRPDRKVRPSRRATTLHAGTDWRQPRNQRRRTLQ